ncbi:hypothetical protein WJX84_002272 [Apatococcus fuscideae]|uniref:Uncharacterized protein n=1 Tax=Apatococcus fuscideae TaxID=2026836 RepID=A0AAW1TAI6_9CHLO
MFRGEQAAQGHTCRLPTSRRSRRSVTRCARSRIAGRRSPQTDEADGNVPAWKQDLARLQQALPALQQSSEQTALQPPTQQQQQQQQQNGASASYGTSKVSRRDRLSSFSAGKLFSNDAAPAANGPVPHTKPTATQLLTERMRRPPSTPSGTGFGPRNPASQAPAPHKPSLAPPQPKGPEGVAGLDALREQFLPPSGAAQLRSAPYKGGITGRGLGPPTGGWVDVSKQGKRPAAHSPAEADAVADSLANLVFSNDGWSVEDLGDGSRAAVPEPYAVEVSQTATLPAAPQAAEPGKERKKTRRRDAMARAISSQGPKPTEELSLAAQLAAIPALSRLSPHEIRELEKMQLETSKNNADVRATAARKKVAARKTHRRLHIMGGKLAGRSLLSGDADTTRPMMEMVRQAVFNMLLAQSEGPSHIELPPNSTWLDLFAGTGAVGLEALSRGCGHASFVELDPWVVDKVLEPNLSSCGLLQQSSIHCMRAEDFVRRSGAGNIGRLQQSFDFISVCPPYLQVSYPELFDLLEASTLLHENTILILEYPKQLAQEIRPQLGPLHKIRDRRYGRTLVAVYGPE